MASTYSSDLQLELIATGEKAGLWGTITNNNLQILELSASGYFTVSIAAADLTLNLDNGSALGDSTATGKNLMIEVTGTLAGNRVITMPTGAERVFIVKDSTTRSNSNYTIGVQNVGGSGTGIVSLPAGSSTAYYTDGTSANSMKLLGTLNAGFYNVVGGTNSPYTAIAGDTLFVSTSAQAAEVVLPASPSQGDTITIMDSSAAGGFATNNCVINRNGNPINTDNTQNVTLSTNNQSLTLIYTNATRGWIFKSTNQ